MAKLTITNQGAGTFQNIEGRTITATASVFEAADVGRLIVVSSHGSSTETTHAVGQYREIVEYVSATQVRVDYPFDVTAWPEEVYADGNPVRDYLPDSVANNILNTGDDFIISNTWEDITTDSTYGTITEDASTTRHRATIGDGHQVSVGTSNSVNANRGALYVKSWDLCYTSQFLYNFASDHSSGNGSGLGGIVVFGRVNPNFNGADIDKNVLGTTLVSVSTGEVIYVQGDNATSRQGKVYKLTGTAASVNVSTNFDTDDWIDLSASNGYITEECNLWWKEEYVSNSRLWRGSGQSGNDGSTGSGGDYGHLHVNGGKIYVDPDGTYGLSGDNLPAYTPDTFVTDTDNTDQERCFIRIFGGSGALSDRENNVRFIGVNIEGPIGGRIRGERSMLLNNKFSRGGNFSGPLHVTASSGTFGLFKGNTFNNKDQAAYIWIQQGANTELAGLEFARVNYGALMAGGSATNARVRFSNFDVDLLETGLNDGTNANRGLVNVTGAQSTSARVFIEQDVSVSIVDNALDPITDSTKLVWEDSQGRENRDVDNTATNPTTTTGTFDTVRMLYWDSGQLTTGSLRPDEDGTTHGDYDFGLVSYENENVYFTNTLANGDVDLTYTIFPDDTIGSITKTQADAYTLISTAEQWRARAKSEQYDAPHTFNVDEEWISRNGDDISSAVQKDYRFLTSSSNGALSYNSTADEIEMVVPVSGVDANIDLGSNDLTVPATYKIIGGLVCTNLVAQWADGETVIDTTEAQNYTVSVDPGTDDITITIIGADVSDLTINRSADATGTVTVVLDGTAGTPTLGTGVQSRQVVPIEVNTDETLYNENSVYIAAFSSSDGSTFNDVDIPTETKNGSSATFEFIIPEDEELYLAMMYRNSSTVYEISGVDQASLLSARTITVTTDEFVDHDEDTDAVGTFVSGTAVSYDSTNDRIEMDVPVTGVTLADQPARIAIWELMAGLGSDDDVYLDSVAKGDIDHDLIEFNAVGMVVKTADDLLIQKVSADNSSIVRLNVQAISAADDTVSVGDDITSSTLNRTVFFSPILDNQVVGASAAAAFDKRLDDRHLTAENVERLGKLQPVNTD